MSTAVPVEASLGCTFHAELKLFTLLLLTPKYLTCLIESNLKGSCLVQTVRVWHRCFASPKLLHPVFYFILFFIGSTGRESSPPPARLSSLDSPAHISSSIPVQRMQLHNSARSTSSRLKWIRTCIKRAVENKRTLLAKVFIRLLNLPLWGQNLSASAELSLVLGSWLKWVSVAES